MKKFFNDGLVWVVRGIKGFNFEIRLISEEVRTLMKLNAVNIDVAALKALRATRPDGITAEDVKNVLYVGKTLRTLFPAPETDPDNPKEGIPCSTCGKSFGAITYNNKDGARRGSVTELKSERFDQMVKDVKDESLSIQDREAAIRFVKASEDLGATMMKGRVLHNVRFFATCPTCVRNERKPRAVIVEGHPLRDERGKIVMEDGVFFSYLTIADALSQATMHDAKIAGGKSRSYVQGLKKGLANFRRPGENRGGYDNRRGGGGNDFHGHGQRRTDDRPRKNVLGGDFLVPSAEAIEKTIAAGKLLGGLAQLAEASDGFLKSNGIADTEAGYNAIKTIARKTLERQAESSPTSVTNSQPTTGATLADSPSAKSLEGLNLPQKKVARRGKNSGPRQSKADRIRN